MAEYFAGGHLRFMDGEWRDDDGNVIEISTVRHGRWVLDEKRYVVYCSECSEPVSYYPNIRDVREENHYCPNCGAKMMEE